MKIENNVPTPKIHDRQNWRIYLSQMNIGDSFLVDGDPIAVSRCRVAVSQYGRLHSMKFAVRSFQDHVRCWRLA